MSGSIILGLMFAAYLTGLVVSLTRVLNHALNNQFAELEKRVKILEKKAERKNRK
jgi:hypothetical protein